jgi:hypothetical protein
MDAREATTNIVIAVLHTAKGPLHVDDEDLGENIANLYRTTYKAVFHPSAGDPTENAVNSR